jgi:very-short-patch-repair endonuclease
MTLPSNAADAVMAAVRAAGGLARGTQLIAQGHRHRTVAELVGLGLQLRIRRVWIAVPDADALALAAARENVVVSCVTQARRLGLWLLDDTAPHVAAASHGASVDVAPGTVVHWSRPLVPRPPGVLFDSIENALALIVACQPEEVARIAIDSALNKRLVERDALLRLSTTARMRTIVEQALPWSDSGLETIFRTRLRWMRLRIVPQAWLAGRPVDFLIGERLVVQIDGGHHVGPQRDADISHDAALMLLGYHVIRVSYEHVVNRWPHVQDLIMRAVAQGLHLAA